MTDLALGDLAVLRQRRIALQLVSESTTRVLASFRVAPDAERADAGHWPRAPDRPERGVGSVESGLIQRLGAGRDARCQLVH